MSGFRLLSFPGSTHSSEHHIIVLDSPVSILPPARERVVVIPGKPGAVRLTPTLGERTFTLNCFMERGATAADARARVDALLAWLTQAGTPYEGQPHELVLDSEPDRYYLAMLDASGIDARSILSHRIFDLRFVCPDPHGYAVTPQSVVRTAAQMPHTHVQTGNATTGPQINIQGRCAPGQSIALTIGGVTMTYRGVLNDAEILAIDCQEQTALRHATGGPFNVLRDFDRPQFYSLVPGNNVMSVATTGGALFVGLSMSCRNRWL